MPMLRIPPGTLPYESDEVAADAVSDLDPHCFSCSGVS